MRSFHSHGSPSPLIRLLVLFALLGAFVIAPHARAQDSSALINEALDKQVDLDLNAVLPGAIRTIEDKTGVPIRPDPIVWDLLPWGEQTNLTARIQNQTLRQALSAITQKLGLTYHLAPEAVVIEPMPALRRLGRRSTVQELQALDLLASKPMPQPAGAATGVQKVQNVLTAIDVQLDAQKTPFAIENRLPTELRNAQVDVPRNATMLDALEAIVKQTRATWYPWGKSIVAVPKETLIRDQLNKTITARYNGADIGQVLEDLRKRSGLDFTIDPGALQRVPPEYRTVKIFWDNVSIAQALESLKGSTGLNYAITDEGIKISNPNPAVAGGAGGGSGDPVAAMVTLENGMQVMIRESQVPPDLRPYLRHRLQLQMDALRQMARQEGFPLTQPAPSGASTTQPARPAAKPQDDEHL